MREQSSKKSSKNKKHKNQNNLQSDMFGKNREETRVEPFDASKSMAEGAKRQYKWNWKKIAIVIIALLAVALVVQPTLIGYSIYQQVESSGYTLDTYAKNINELEHNLGLAASNLSLHADTLQERQKKLDDTFLLYTQCLEDKSALKGDLSTSISSTKNLETQLSDARTKADEEIVAKTQEMELSNAACVETAAKKEDELHALQAQYDALSANAARNICCKQKVDNPSLDSYDVVSNKVVCLEGGENVLNCDLSAPSSNEK